MAIMQVNSGLHCPWRNGAYVCGDYFHILFPTIIVILTTKVMFKIKGSSRLLYSQTNKAWFFIADHIDEKVRSVSCNSSMSKCNKTEDDEEYSKVNKMKMVIMVMMIVMVMLMMMTKATTKKWLGAPKTMQWPTLS